MRNAYLPLLQVWSLYVSRRVRLYQNAVSARVFRLSHRTLASNVTVPQRSTLVPLVQRDPPGRMAGAFFFFFCYLMDRCLFRKFEQHGLSGNKKRIGKKNLQLGQLFMCLCCFFLLFFCGFNFAVFLICAVQYKPCLVSKFSILFPKRLCLSVATVSERSEDAVATRLLFLFCFNGSP